MILPFVAGHRQDLAVSHRRFRGVEHTVRESGPVDFDCEIGIVRRNVLGLSGERRHVLVSMVRKPLACHELTQQGARRGYVCFVGIANQVDANRYQLRAACIAQGEGKQRPCGLPKLRPLIAVIDLADNLED